jgi:AraC family transcriptional regulator of adaptative response / methylphosphotriester-DNA alkyltransferase methyltransferase
MTDDEKLDAFLRHDASYDGLFFIAVKTTGIYCRPSCKSKPPKRENFLFIDTGDEARAAGFRACKRCRPDLLEYQPIRDIAEKAKKLIDEAFREKRKLDTQLRDIGVTQHRITEIFKEQYGVTLFEYMNRLRLEEAKRLLLKTNNEIINIAYSVGFESLSAFYRFFKNGAGQSPAAYPKENAGCIIPLNTSRPLDCSPSQAMGKA